MYKQRFTTELALRPRHVVRNTFRGSSSLTSMQNGGTAAIFQGFRNRSGVASSVCSYVLIQYVNRI